MKKTVLIFFIKFFVLFSFISIFSIYCEIKLRELPNSHSIKKQNLEKNLDSIQILVLGSSQTLFGINPELFPKEGFNLADLSQSLYYDKEISLKYINRMPELKCVLISISYFSLWYQLYAFEEWRDYFYYQFWKIPVVGYKILKYKTV